MYHYNSKNQKMYWNGKLIGVLDGKHLGCKIETRPLAPDQIDSTPLAIHAADVVNAPETVEFEQELTCLEQELLKKIEEAKDMAREIKRNVEELDKRKLDKPSLSPEMLDAERYIDDFNEVRQKYRVQRFAQKQRTRRKLERIKKANEFSKKKTTSPWLIALLVACINVAAFFVLFS